jgi:hypothetical protein
MTLLSLHLHRQGLRNQRPDSTSTHEHDHAGSPALASRGLRDRGSASVWMLSLTVIAGLIVGLVIDGSSRLDAMRDADHAAAEAARAGAQALPGSIGFVSSTGALPGSAQALAAANAYLSAAGVPGSASASPDGSLTVSTTVSWSPKFLSVIGVGASDVRGSAAVSLVRGVEGVQR